MELNWKNLDCSECLFRVECHCKRFPQAEVVARVTDIWFANACAEYAWQCPPVNDKGMPVYFNGD